MLTDMAPPAQRSSGCLLTCCSAREDSVARLPPGPGRLCGGQADAPILHAKKNAEVFKHARR